MVQKRIFSSTAALFIYFLYHYEVIWQFKSIAYIYIYIYIYTDIVYKLGRLSYPNHIIVQINKPLIHRVTIDKGGFLSTTVNKCNRQYIGNSYYILAKDSGMVYIYQINLQCLQGEKR